MSYRVVLLPGDGIGYEVMHEARLLLEAIHQSSVLSLELEEIPCGGKYYLEHPGFDWPQDSPQRCAEADLLLLGAVGWPGSDGKGLVRFADGRMAGCSAVLGNRRDLDLYANVRPVKMLAGVRHRIHGRHREVWHASDVDLVIVRENTEGLYAGVGGTVGPSSRPTFALDERVITRAGSERVIRYAFVLARQRRRGAPRDGCQRVTCLSKDNVLVGCKLFTEVFREVAMQFPDIEAESLLIDAFTAYLMTEPERFDVCVTTNLFGDIITDLAAVLQGGMGMAYGGNMGDAHAMFEPVHGSAPSLVGGKANPLAMMQAVAFGLRWLADKHGDVAPTVVADIIDQSVAAVVARGEPLTGDLVGDDRAATTAETAAAVRALVEHRLALTKTAAAKP